MFQRIEAIFRYPPCECYLTEETLPYKVTPTAYQNKLAKVVLRCSKCKVELIAQASEIVVRFEKLPGVSVASSDDPSDAASRRMELLDQDEQSSDS